MKVLLVGPHPPPHGGVSVHVAALRRQLAEAGAEVRVLDLDPRAPRSADRLTIRGGLDLVRTVWAHARDGYVVHLHTNGHNVKSWLIVLAVGVAARPAPRALVTLHSGMLPAFLADTPWPWRLVARIGLRFFASIVCVNGEIERALRKLGANPSSLQVRPAFIAPRLPEGGLPQDLDSWIAGRSPVLSTALFYRPEYGADILVDALARLRRQYEQVGCVVMGSGDRQEMERLVSHHGLQESVRLVGDLSHDECLKVMARSDVFVRPTRADGDSISVREALSLGVPTVASRVGTRPEGAYLFPVGDVDALVAAVHQALRHELSGDQSDARAFVRS
jgi:glycogen(starch) synthase